MTPVGHRCVSEPVADGEEVETIEHSGRTIRRSGARYALGQVGAAYAETDCKACSETVRVDARTVEQATTLLLTRATVEHLRSRHLQQGGACGSPPGASR